MSLVNWTLFNSSASKKNFSINLHVLIGVNEFGFFIIGFFRRLRHVVHRIFIFVTSIQFLFQAVRLYKSDVTTVLIYKKSFVQQQNRFLMFHLEKRRLLMFHISICRTRQQEIPKNRSTTYCNVHIDTRISSQTICMAT